MRVSSSSSSEKFFLYFIRPIINSPNWFTSLSNFFESTRKVLIEVDSNEEIIHLNSNNLNSYPLNIEFNNNEIIGSDVRDSRHGNNTLNNKEALKNSSVIFTIFIKHL